MRHRTIDQAHAALRRGASVEQLLVGSDLDGRPVVRWLTLVPTRDGGVEMRVHYVFDVGSDDFLDVSEFPPVDEYAGEGKSMGVFSSPQDALLNAELEWRASPDRWVNGGLVGDEYATRRSTQAP